MNPAPEVLPEAVSREAILSLLEAQPEARLFPFGGPDLRLRSMSITLLLRVEAHAFARQPKDA